jgi:glycerol-3-phosphate dehydrogenase
MAEVFADVLGPDHPSCFLSGPSFAGELIRSQPTGMVLAASNLEWARAAAPLFHSPTLRVYLSDDVVGVEMTGALKNVCVICASSHRITPPALGIRVGMIESAVIPQCSFCTSRLAS